jgi:hypothetical protein
VPRCISTVSGRGTRLSIDEHAGEWLLVRVRKRFEWCRSGPASGSITRKTKIRSSKVRAGVPHTGQYMLLGWAWDQVASPASAQTACGGAGGQPSTTGTHSRRRAVVIRGRDIPRCAREKAETTLRVSMASRRDSVSLLETGSASLLERLAATRRSQTAGANKGGEQEEYMLLSGFEPGDAKRRVVREAGGVYVAASPCGYEPGPPGVRVTGRRGV